MIPGDIVVFAGHLHPLIVHLPIGFILLAVVFNLLSYSAKFANLKPAEPVLLFFSFVSAFLSCVFGYVLSLSGDYDPAILSRHEFSGIMLAAITGLFFFLSIDRVKKEIHVPRRIFSCALIGLIFLMTYSGHQGASLTHGNDYLTIQTMMREVRKKPASLQTAFVFEDVVAPILQDKCAPCHREGKQKGNFSVESLQTLLKGGKSGPAVVAGDITASEMYKRITLPPEHKDFMPADGKAPLTRTETEIIKWWIEKGKAEKGRLIGQYSDSEKIKPKINAYLGFTNDIPGEGDEDRVTQTINPEIPGTADTASINKLRKKGLMVRIMLEKPAMLDIILPARSGVKMTEIESDLQPLAKNIIWLNLSDNNLTTPDLEILKSFSNLENLRLNKNPLDDNISNVLISLRHLEAVNLNETGITTLAINHLQKNSAIKRLYHWKTATDKK